MVVHESTSVTSLLFRGVPFRVEATWFGVFGFISRDVPVITCKHCSCFKVISVVLVVFAVR